MPVSRPWCGCCWRAGRTPTRSSTAVCPHWSLLLRRAPKLATEERALLAADHPATEALIRAVARGETVAHVSEGCEVVAGPAGKVIVCPDGRPPLLVGVDSSLDLDVPPVPLPHEHAYDSEGEHPRVGLTGE
jgi:hypothetical protein